MPEPSPSFRDGRAAWVADLDRVAARDRWGRALAAVGGVHLAFFLACQLMHDAGDRTNWHYVAMWGMEFATALVVLGAIAGRGWARSTPLAGLIARVWGTVLILSLSLASLNTLSGLDHEWFKPVLCTLASFGFMMMAYLVSPWFFAAAVWMSLTGVLMVRALDASYLIHGLSWFVALMAIGAALEIRRRRDRAARPAPVRVEVAARPFATRSATFRAGRPS